MSVAIPFVPYPVAGTRLRAAAVGVLVVAAIAGVALGAAGAGLAPADADYVRLMRFMAATKALLALAASSAIIWRLGAPAGRAWLAAYAFALAAMAAGPGLIWGMSHIVAGSLLLHGGLLAGILLLWRDKGTGQCLEQAITRRRLQRLGLVASSAAASTGP